MTKIIDPRNLTVALGYVLGFLFFNFNQLLGTAYLFMLILDYIIFSSSREGILYPLEKDTKRLQDIAFGIVAYVGFVALSFVTLPLFQVAIGVFEQLGANTPLLASSKFLMVFGWGVLIPVVETRLFFGRGLQFVAELMSVRLELVNGWIPTPGTAFVITFLSAGFTVFHLTAKAAIDFVQTTGGLYLTFLFAIISCYMIIKLKELAAAVYFHIFTNTLAVLVRLQVPFVMGVLGLPTD